MTTYVQNKTRMFMERRDWLRPERRRSESRLKAYPSSTDLRNWCNVVEDRRQHILELMQKRIDGCPGKLVPLDALLNVLMDMTGGVGDPSKIKRCLRQLSNFIAQLKLNSEDLKELNKTIENMDPKCIANMNMAIADRLGRGRGADDDEEKLVVMRGATGSQPLQQGPVEEDPDKVATMEALCRCQRDKLEALTKQRDTLLTKLDACLKELDKLKTLKDKLENQEDLTKERDDLAGKVRSLEAQLEEYQDLSGNVAELRNKLEILDSVLQERDHLCKRISMMRNLEEEVERLRVEVERMDELERELRNTSKAARSAELELKKSQSRAGNLETELWNARCERDVMKNRIENMKREMDHQRANVTKAEMLRLERDLLQIKLSEFADLQSQYEGIMDKMELFATVKAERDAYKQKYEEALDGGWQSHILKSQIDETKTTTRERDQLRQQVGNLGPCICEQEEAQSLHSRVKELEKLLHSAEHTMLQKDCRIRYLEGQVACGSGSWRNRLNEGLQEIVSPMKLVSGDHHLTKLLKQSEYAVKKVVHELVKQDKEWGRTEINNPKWDFGSNQGKCPCVPASGFNRDDCEKLREKLEELQKGKQNSELAAKHV